jgi:proteasome lid subunit RPN8/RPN11
MDRETTADRGYGDISFAERREELYYSSRFGHTYEDLEEHRSRYTALERVVLSKSYSEQTPEEREIHNQISTREFRKLEENEEYQKGFNARIAQAMRAGFRKDLLAIFRGEIQEIPNPAEIRITQEAYEKAWKISRRAVEACNSSTEVYFHTLDRIGSQDATIRDIYVAHQIASGGECSPIPEKESEDFEEIRKQGNKIIGWAHSHGDIGTFHSGTDNHNLRHIPYIYGYRRTFMLKTFSETRPVPFSVWIAPSIVFNSSGRKPSSCVSFEYTDLGRDDPKIYINESPSLRLLDESNGIHSDEYFIDSEIFRKVVPESGFRRSFTERMNSELEIKADYGDSAKMNIPEENIDIWLIKEVFRLNHRVENLELRLKKHERRPKWISKRRTYRNSRDT